MNKSFVWDSNIVNNEVFFSLLMKKLEFKTITKVQHKKVEKAKPKNDPSVLSSLKYFSSVKNKINFLYSPVIKINVNKIGPAK